MDIGTCSARRRAGTASGGRVRRRDAGNTGEGAYSSPSLMIPFGPRAYRFVDRSDVCVACICWVCRPASSWGQTAQKKQFRASFDISWWGFEYIGNSGISSMKRKDKPRKVSTPTLTMAREDFEIARTQLWMESPGQLSTYLSLPPCFNLQSSWRWIVSSRSPARRLDTYHGSVCRFLTAVPASASEHRSLSVLLDGRATIHTL